MDAIPKCPIKNINNNLAQELELIIPSNWQKIMENLCIFFSFRTHRFNAEGNASITEQCVYLYDGAYSSRDEHQEAGLLVKQVQEDDDGAEAAPQYWGDRRHTQTGQYKKRGGENPMVDV